MRALFLILALVSFTAPAVSFAEKIIIPLARQGDKSIDVPTLGSSKEVVESKYGTPQSKTKPVGKPPISKWVYKDFTVYFESNHVIKAVKHFKKKAKTIEIQ